MSALDFVAMLDRNKTNSPEVCASHDFCDSNMVMHKAFLAYGVNPTEIENEELRKNVFAIWNEAWALAKAAQFNPLHVQRVAAARGETRVDYSNPFTPPKPEIDFAALLLEALEAYLFNGCINVPKIREALRAAGRIPDEAKVLEDMCTRLVQQGHDASIEHPGYIDVKLPGQRYSLQMGFSNGPLGWCLINTETQETLDADESQVRPEGKIEHLLTVATLAIRNASVSVSDLPAKPAPSDPREFIETCKRAAEQQGLKPLMDALTSAHVPWELHDDGGYSMFVRVTIDRDRYILAALNEKQHDDTPELLLGFYDENAADFDPESPSGVALTHFATVQRTVAMLAAILLANEPAPQATVQ